jgi:predicted nucleic acid-binding protein
MHLLDRNTVQELINGNQNVRKNLVAALPTGVGLSAITEAQIRVTLTRAQPAALGVFDSIMQRAISVPWDSKCAQLFASIDSKLPPNHGIAPLDLWGAVHSIAIGGIFVSNMGAVHLVPGVMVKDWTVLR